MPANNPNQQKTPPQRTATKPEITQPEGAPSGNFPPPAPVSKDQPRQAVPDRRPPAGGTSSPGVQDKPARDRPVEGNPERSPRPATAVTTADDEESAGDEASEDTVESGVPATREEPARRGSGNRSES